MRLEIHDNGVYQGLVGCLICAIKEDTRKITRKYTYEENRGCSEDKENLRLELRVDEALGINLSLLQTEQRHQLYNTISFCEHWWKWAFIMRISDLPIL